jgi:mono/diheme cytochrome c family protein
MKRWVQFFFFPLLCAALTTQCQQPHPRAEVSSDEGAKLFVHYCAGCHLGNGSGGQTVPGGDMEAIDIRQMTKTAPELVSIISYGFGKMPGFKDSTSTENISMIADYVATQIEAHQGTSASAPGVQRDSRK